MNAELEEQADELLALQSIFDSEEFVRNESKAAGEIRVSVQLPADFTVVLKEGNALRRYEISFLPPLFLNFDLPETYPSSSIPSFSLTCSWLTHAQLSALTAQLADLYQATGGTVILFSWVQFLREDALTFLDIRDVLELPSDEHRTALSEPNHQHSQNKLTSHDGKVCKNDPDTDNEKNLSSGNGFKNICDDSDQSENLDVTEAAQASPEADHQSEGAVSPPSLAGELTPSQTLLSQILIHQAELKRKVFAATLFECGVCFISSLGSECMQLSVCGHVFCRACLAEFCRVQITEGNVRGVTCLEAGCATVPTPAQVKCLVGDELFSRYDHILLQSTLDLMPDVVYCPRQSCGSAFIRETSSTAALCSDCGFAFCVTCRKTYHGADDCYAKKPQKGAEQEDVLSLPQTREGIKALMADYTHGSKERKRLLETRYGRGVMLFTVEELLSSEWLTSNSKRCPHCFSNIEKNGGCNIMICIRCNQKFCWACLSRLSGRGSREPLDRSHCQYCSYYA